MAIKQRPDSPTNNFATLNPLEIGSNTTFSNGNLDVVLGASGGGWRTAKSTITVSLGKWYIEANAGTLFSGLSANVGVVNAVRDVRNTYASLFSDGYMYNCNGEISKNNSVIRTESSWTTNDVVGVALDLDANTVRFYKNGVAQGAAISGLPNASYAFAVGGVNVSNTLFLNFGQDPTFGGAKSPSTTYTDAEGIGAFYYQPPTGALALCTANLPEMTPTVDDDVPKDYFKAVTYTGNANTLQITNVGFKPDLIWIKRKSGTYNANHCLFDSVRGTSGNNSTSPALFSSSNSSEQVKSLASFDNSGFTLSSYDSGAEVNATDGGATYVAWSWKAGGAPQANNSNTSGAMTANSVSLNGTLQSSYTPAGSPTIYPTRMSINTNAGFSIVSYTGTETSSQTIPHGLSQRPDFVITKSLGTAHWGAWHTNLSGNSYFLGLNQTAQESSSTTVFYNFTDEIIGVGSDIRANATAGVIAYCWHSVEGYSKFGSYTGNGSPDGQFVYCGFRPAYVMVKRTVTDGYGWFIWDTAREPHNYMYNFLAPNTITNEANNTYYKIDFLSNGFKLRNDDGIMNASTNYIFMAFAEQPFNYANAR